MDSSLNFTADIANIQVYCRQISSTLRNINCDRSYLKPTSYLNLRILQNLLGEKSNLNAKELLETDTVEINSLDG